ncbi:MAG: ATP synthase F1 subunit gamma [Candidatus Binataceae bacterium]
MASLKAIRRRIATTKSTQQITRAMKLVAAARLRRAQNALMNARPYGAALTRVAGSVLASQHILAPDGARRAALIVVVAADRGQCGSYNSNALNTAEAASRRLREQGIEPRLFAVGKKAVDHYRRYRIALAGERMELRPKLASIGLARDIAHLLLSDFRSGEASEVAIVYSRFVSALTQRPTYEKLLPIEAADAAGKQPADYIFEPNRDELVPVVLRTYIEMAVFHALLEAEASEQAARMTAMDNATNNAQKMIQSLTLEMNRARQAQITRELMDIVGGSEALRG